MDKSNHRITVDREYLEILEKFYENNQNENNTKLSVRNALGFPTFFLQLHPDTHIQRDIQSLYIIDKDGRELAFFRNTQMF
jgi:hypothetical protein